DIHINSVMVILSPEIRDFVKTQKLGFVATVCRDGTPNLSPKGTTTVWDDGHLVFADIHSPGTVENLLHNPAIEINIVSVFTRKGYRFKGTGKVLSGGPLFDEIIASYRKAGSAYDIKNVVLVEVDTVSPLVSPVYDTGLQEEDVVKRWIEYWREVYDL
ncbi:MAG TPA: pyridoxamine 5'-phosphate oxidase family protein, partial [Bacteroidales bacterium]|nr:pyridoxamine 5'-phosphate oxidase family protein [Bacteroidales bacterium]